MHPDSGDRDDRPIRPDFLTGWLAAGNTKETLLELVKSQKPYQNYIDWLNSRHAAAMIGGKFVIINETKDPDKIFVVAPYDFEKPNAFERHVNQIFSSLTVDPATGKKRLKVGECTRLRNHIQNAPVDVAVKGDIKDYPALAALGGVVHSLMMLMPWLGFSKPERTTPTIQDPLTELQEDHDQDWWENESDDYGEQEEYDDGALVGTE